MNLDYGVLVRVVFQRAESARHRFNLSDRDLMLLEEAGYALRCECGSTLLPHEGAFSCPLGLLIAQAWEGWE